jgi:hypothetical protein
VTCFTFPSHFFFFSLFAFSLLSRDNFSHHFLLRFSRQVVGAAQDAIEAAAAAAREAAAVALVRSHSRRRAAVTLAGGQRALLRAELVQLAEEKEEEDDREEEDREEGGRRRRSGEAVSVGVGVAADGAEKAARRSGVAVSVLLLRPTAGGRAAQPRLWLPMPPPPPPGQEQQGEEGGGSAVALLAAFERVCATLAPAGGRGERSVLGVADGELVISLE